MKNAPLPPDPLFKPDEKKFRVDFYQTTPSTEPVEDVYMYVHHPSKCEKQPVCGIHQPTPHHMSTWPRLWRSYEKMMYRRCPHGYLHPDPDEVAYRKWSGKGTIHFCPDDCCLTEEDKALPF